MPESFLQQFFYPFLLVARRFGLTAPRPQPADGAAS